MNIVPGFIKVGFYLIEFVVERFVYINESSYLMGDFNRDLLQVNIKKTWLEYMESFGLEQIVKSPTRITDHSETLIDHIIL